MQTPFLDTVSGKFDGVSLSELADSYGTPLYVYSLSQIEKAIEDYKAGIDRPVRLCYAMKANSNLGILEKVRSMGIGADIVSGGELHKALLAGFDPQSIVFSGVGKTDNEIKSALDAEIMLFSVESHEELAKIAEIAESAKKKARVSLRLNPDVDPGSHPYISTGLKKNKFGIAFAQARNLIQQYRHNSSIEISCIGCHIGSQITNLGAFDEAANKIVDLARELLASGLPLKYIDLGGGLGIPYEDEEIPDRGTYVNRLCKIVGDLPVTLVLEPGRSIVAESGILISRIIFTKHNGTKPFYICDAAMNDLLRPALYGAFHHVYSWPSRETGALADLVGPVCESGDFIAKDRALPTFERDDLGIIVNAGAYAFAMSSQYNMRPRAAEVLVYKGRHFLARSRETYEDLVRYDHSAEKWFE